MRESFILFLLAFSLCPLCPLRALRSTPDSLHEGSPSSIRRRTAWRRAFAPRSSEAASVNSSGAWLMPLTLGTKSIPVGMTRATIPASWPGPLGKRIGVTPMSPHAAASVSIIAGCIGVGGVMSSGRDGAVTCSSAQSVCTRRVYSACAALRMSGLMSRNSAEKVAVPGTMFGTSGVTRSRPTVATTSGPVSRATSRCAAIARAIAMPASRRIGKGVEPAWLGWPVICHSCRSMPQMPVTTASSPARRLQARPLLDVHLEVRADRPPVASATDAISIQLHARRRQRLPRARPGNGDVVIDNRRADEGHAAEEAGAEVRALLVRPGDNGEREGRRRCPHPGACGALPTPASTPNAPSNLPPFGTASMCEPSSSAGPLPTCHRPHIFVAASSRRRQPRRREPARAATPAPPGTRATTRPGTTPPPSARSDPARRGPPASAPHQSQSPVRPRSLLCRNAIAQRTQRAQRTRRNAKEK